MDNGFRWLTVNPSEQADLEVMLFPLHQKSMALTRI